MTYAPPRYHDTRWGSIDDAAIAWHCRPAEIERWVAEGRLVGFNKRGDAGWILPLSKYGPKAIAKLREEDALARDARTRLRAAGASE